MWAGLGLGGEFIKSGLAAPMDKYYTQYKWDDEFIAPALAFSKQYAGGRFGLPSTFRGEALYYNKALFQKAGITSECAQSGQMEAAPKTARAARRAQVQ
jgi:raffinose/stachyose/melibiose transport system substrate-binding protein